MNKLWLLLLAIGMLSIPGFAACPVDQHGTCLNWTLSPTQGVNKQLVCRSTTTGTEDCATPLSTIPDGVTTSFLDTTGTPGVSYFYIVKACINNACSAPSNEATNGFPPAPQSGLTPTSQ